MKDLNLLYTFDALWHTRSVTLSAERLGVTQAAVSGSLKKLRLEFDDQMFTLVGRRMEPTPLAISLADQLLDAMGLLKRVRVSKASFDPASTRRLFTIRTRDIGEVVCLPSVMAALRHEAPHVRIRTVYGPVEETVPGLASGRLDLAMGFLPSLVAGIHRRILFSQHYVCVMRKDHPAAQSELTRERYASESHLLIDYSGSGHHIIERELIALGAREKISLRVPQYLSAPHFVKDSNLLWTAPSGIAAELSKHYDLVLRPVPIELPKFEIALYWHERFHRDPASKWFRDFVANNLSLPEDVRRRSSH